MQLNCDDTYKFNPEELPLQYEYCMKNKLWCFAKTRKSISGSNHWQLLSRSMTGLDSRVKIQEGLRVVAAPGRLSDMVHSDC